MSLPKTDPIDLLNSQFKCIGCLPFPKGVNILLRTFDNLEAMVKTTGKDMVAVIVTDLQMVKLFDKKSVMAKNIPEFYNYLACLHAGGHESRIKFFCVRDTWVFQIDVLFERNVFHE